MKLYLAAIASNMGMLAVGTFFGWASPSLPLLLQDDSPVKLTVEEAAWVASLFTLGGTVGSTMCSFLVNVIGRKNTMLFTTVPNLIGWVIIAFATKPWELYISRFASGICAGHMYVSTIMYIGEIAPASVRGFLTLTLTVSAKLGGCLSFAIAPFVSVRAFAYISLILPTIFFVMTLLSPESPYHLLRRGKYTSAMSSLAQLRNEVDVTREMAIIEKSVTEDLANDSGLWEILSVQGNRRALTIVTVLVIIQQWSGSLAVQSYAQMIFDSADTNFEGKYVTIILGVVQVLSAIVSTGVVDRFGRRPLLMISCLGASLSTMIVGVFFYMQHIQMDVSKIGWLPGFGGISYIVVYNLGLGGLPFTLMSELFPTNVKALCSTIIMATCNLCAFTVTLTYQSIANSLGTYTAFWLFSAISLMGVVFSFFCIPETKGKTLQEIQEVLQGGKRK